MQPLATYRALRRARSQAWDRLQRWPAIGGTHNEAQLAYSLACEAYETATESLSHRCAVCRRPNNPARCRFGAPRLCSCWHGIPC